MLVELEHVCRSFFTDRVETRALREVSLTIAQGEYVAVEGPSGCGKSTLLSVLGLLESPDRGRYALAGRDVHGLSTAERAALRNRRIGFVFQNFNRDASGE